MDHLRVTTDPRFADYHRVWQEIDMPEVLYMAGIVHDIGKQWPGDGAHDVSGAHAAEQIARRLSWSDEQCALLAFLVRNHLLMAETSRLRDLSLDETIRDFTRVVDDNRKLNMLLLLTCADTNQVGEGVWSEMKARFLLELYGRADTELSAAAGRSGPGEDGQSSIPRVFVPDLAKHRERIRRQLSQHNLPPDAIHDHTAWMPAQYLLNTSLEDMYVHMAMINRLRSTTTPTIDFRTDFGTDYTELTIVAYDDPTPGLLSKIFGVMYALDVNIYVSQVFTRDTSVRIAIDTLWVDFRGKPLSAAKKSEVQDTVRSILLGRESLTELFERRRKPEKQQIVNAAKIDDTISERYSILEIHAPMEPGVGYRLASGVSQLGWNIHSARMSLWGSRVRAAFYVTDPNGRKVPADQANLLYTVLRREEAPSRRAQLSAPAQGQRAGRLV